MVSIDFTLRFMLKNKLVFLKNQGYEVHAVCSPGKRIGEIEKHGIKVKTMRIKRKISVFSDLILFFKLIFYFKKEKFDIVHTHTLKPEFWGQIAAKIAGVPIIINTIHGLVFDKGENPSLKGKFFIFLQRFSARQSDLIFAVSKAVIDTAIENKIGRPALLKYLGRDIDTDRFNPQKFSKEFIANKKKQLGIDPNKKVIGIVARLVKEKGYLELFEALKRVSSQFSDTLLLIIGPKELEKEDAIDIKIVKKYGTEDNVVFLGERIDIDEIYPLMDIFVLPTHREGVGASILEALAMEIPVVVSDTGGCPEAVDNGKTGILVPVKNVEKLIQALVYLLNNPEVGKKMGEEGRKKILREFNQKIVFDRMIKEYNRLIKEKL